MIKVNLIVVSIVLVVSGLVYAKDTAGLGFGLGLSGSLEQELDQTQDPDPVDLNPSLTINPWMEKKLHEMGYVGGSLHLTWLKADSNNDYRFTLHPMLRSRLSFPLVNNTTFDGIFSIGPSLWFESDEFEGRAGETRLGYAVRFAFGVSHPLNRDVNVYGNIGYMRSSTFGGNSEISMDYVPLFVGLKSRH